MNPVQQSIVLATFATTILSMFLLGSINHIFAVEFSNYTSEKYSIQFQYPSQWELTEKTSRFEEGSDIFISGSILDAEAITIQYADNLEYYFGSSNLETALLAGFNDIKNLAFGQDVRVIEAPSYTTIDNQKAGTYLITMKDKYDDDAIKTANQVWEVFVDNHGYLISFVSTANTFDNSENVEIRKQFINSIKFLNTGKSLLQIADKPPIAKTSHVFEFSGQNYADMAGTDRINPNSFTVSLWFNSKVDPTEETILVNKGSFKQENDITGNNLNFGLYLTKNGQVSGGFETSKGDSYIVTSPKSYNDEKWHQAILTFDQTSSTLKLYLDSIQVATNTTGLGLKPDTTGKTPIRLGASSLSENENIVKGFTGRLDDFTLWDVAATENQILDLFNKESKFIR